MSRFTSTRSFREGRRLPRTSETSGFLHLPGFTSAVTIFVTTFFVRSSQMACFSSRSLEHLAFTSEAKKPIFTQSHSQTNPFHSVSEFPVSAPGSLNFHSFCFDYSIGSVTVPNITVTVVASTRVWSVSRFNWTSFLRFFLPRQEPCRRKAALI